MLVFINKLDRVGKDVFDLLDEVEQKLNMKVRPMSFPIGMGPDFQGVYNLYEKKLVLFDSHGKQELGEVIEINDIYTPDLEGHIGERAAKKLREEIELVEGVYPPFEVEEYLSGRLNPVFFGSAINNFGVKELLDCFVEIAPPPRPSPTEQREIAPDEKKFTGFVFKIHANIDPNHRDRIAFVRVCSGVFERNKNYLHVRHGKQYKFSNPTAFMADKKDIIDESFPGDIVGLHDTGKFVIGDTLTEGEKLKFTGIPSFAPEIFKYAENADPLKSKQFAKGLEQLMDEGVAQLFTTKGGNRKIIGTVGALQFEVIQHRLQHEYSATCRYEPANFFKACWVTSDDANQLAEFNRRRYPFMATDKHGRDVFLATSQWELNAAEKAFPEVRFHFTSEF
jgi:peptide chain release factor 3